MNKFKVGVLLATYNGAQYLEEQLNSLLGQQGVDVHIFIRDDGSVDQTLKIINSYKAHKNVTLIDGKFSTGSAAGNFIELMRAAPIKEYEFIALSDQDDIWFPDKISRSIKMLNEGDAMAYSSDLIAFDTQIQNAWYLRKSAIFKEYDYIFQGASAGCTYVLTRKAIGILMDVLFDGNKKYPKDFSHDWLIYSICRSHGIKWVHDNMASIAYRQHSSNVFGALPGKRGLYTRLKISKSGWYRKHVIFISQFLKGSNDELKITAAVKRFNIFDRIALARSSYKFRRKSWDCLLISLIIIFGFF